MALPFLSWAGGGIMTNCDSSGEDREEKSTFFPILSFFPRGRPMIFWPRCYGFPLPEGEGDRKSKEDSGYLGECRRYSGGGGGIHPHRSHKQVDGEKEETKDDPCARPKTFNHQRRSKNG